jgi:hypothetical protein
MMIAEKAADLILGSRWHPSTSTSSATTTFHQRPGSLHPDGQSLIGCSDSVCPVEVQSSRRNHHDCL